MSEEFHFKHIHSVVWLIAIILVAITIAGFLIIKLTGNAPVGEIVPEVNVAPAATSGQSDSGQDATTVTTSRRTSQDGIEAGHAVLKADTTVNRGEEISVEVTMDTDSKNINIARMTLIYDPSSLRFEGFDRTGSVLPMEFRNEPESSWVVVSRGAPGDSNPNDSDDGYTGNDGKFGSFIFTALQPGETEVSLGFHSTIYYLDDGLGSKMYPTANKLNIIVN